MNIYLVSQDENNGYDTYDSFICYAETEDNARNMLPASYCKWKDRWSSWCSSPDKASIELLGSSNEKIEEKIILASFNAG